MIAEIFEEPSVSQEKPALCSLDEESINLFQNWADFTFYFPKYLTYFIRSGDLI